MGERTMIEALNLALREAMEADESVVVLGEDVGVDGGVFRVTDGLIDDYGPSRVIDTPLAEAGIVGASIGMAVGGLRPVPEIQFSGFSYMAFHQLENHAGRFRARTQGRHAVPLVVRMPYGGGVRALEHHSESREAYYAHTPGLKMVIPSGPRNARGLLAAAIEDPDPVVFFEPKASYRAFREEVPDERETVPLGEAEVVREGGDVTVVAYGAMMRPAQEAAERLAEDGIEVELIDLRTISPLDDEPICTSLRKTGHAVVVHEAPRSFGPAAEIIARLQEKALLYMEAPVARVTGFDVPMPLFRREQAYLPDAERIVDGVRQTLEF